VLATSSTTAEEARAIDGPVMRSRRIVDLGALATLWTVCSDRGDCLYLVQDSRRTPLSGRPGLVGCANQSVVSPRGGDGWAAQ
jgi:hypothetical protein